MTEPFLKICGITRLEDAEHALQCGATALGFVLWPRSPRYVAPEKVSEILAGLPSTTVAVGVFVNERPDEIARIMTETRLAAVQLHGDETLSDAASLSWPILRSVTLESVDAVTAAWPASTTFLLDAADSERRGGTGRRVDWKKAAAVARNRRVVLAGGLTAENVGSAILTVRPYGVDVSSGVEDAPGVKNARKVAQFLTAARTSMVECVQSMEK